MTCLNQCQPLYLIYIANLFIQIYFVIKTYCLTPILMNLNAKKDRNEAAAYLVSKCVGFMGLLTCVQQDIALSN